MNVLITAGATREPIDDVRFLSNVSTGATGAALAEALAAAGHAVTLLRGMASVSARNVAHDEVFSSAMDLSARLRRQLATGSFGLVIMTAAVADYRPAAPVAGKLSSAAERLTLELIKNPKILPHLKSLTAKPLRVVGFKLTSGADAAQREAAVSAQFANGGVDVVVHNDLAEIRATPRERHPFRLYHDSNVESEQLAGTAALAARLTAWLEGGSAPRAGDSPSPSASSPRSSSSTA